MLPKAVVRRARGLARRTLISGHNALQTNEFAPRFYSEAHVEAFRGSRPRQGGISDDLPTIYADVVSAPARLVVELGTAGGESTKAILAEARSVARVLGFDIDDCAGVPTSNALKAR